MLRFLLRRLILIPIVLIAINFIGFAFAHYTAQFQQSQTIFGSGQEGTTPVWPVYAAYVQGALQGDFGKMPTGISETVGESVRRSLGASLGLLALAFAISLTIGLVIGLAAVNEDPPLVRPWLTLIATVGLSMPGFFIGTLLVGLIIMSMLGSSTRQEPFLPVAGFGWDAHLVLPLVALVIRPTMQIAQVSGSLLASELSKRYVVAARAIGHTWRTIRWEKALRNVLAPILVIIAGSFRVLITELVLVEWLFQWPGIGRLLVLTLVPPRVAGLGGYADTSIYFLDPPLVAALLTVFALLFLLVDLVATGLARLVDPRVRSAEEELPND